MSFKVVKLTLATAQCIVCTFSANEEVGNNSFNTCTDISITRTGMGKKLFLTRLRLEIPFEQFCQKFLKAEPQKRTV